MLSREELMSRLEAATAEVRKLMQYLEDHPEALNPDEGVYCQQKIREAVQHLRVGQRLLDRYYLQSSGPLLWN